MWKRPYCKYFKILLMEVAGMNWETGIKGQIMAFWSLKHMISHGSWVLLLPPFSFLPSQPPGTAVGGRFPSWEASVIFSFADREFLGRPDSCASKAWLGLACYTFLWVTFEHSFIGVMLKESLQWQLSLRWMNVHIALKRPHCIG